jgi:hypothetical protein
MNYSKEIIAQVWQKARAMAGTDSDEWRQDECGAWMHFDKYGSEASDFGWKIVTVSAGGSEQVDHLRPYHRDNDFDVGSGHISCRVKADREGVLPTAHIDEPRNQTIA